jgi:arylsulfatase A-like enzyme
VLLLALAATAACSDPQPPVTGAILISIDTLRYDHLDCYGYERNTSPNLDKLCDDAAVFDQAISQAPSTLPSHASMLTSLIPQHHGASFAEHGALPKEVETLAELFRAHGFRTASFNDGGQVAGIWGLGQGFQIYHSNEPGHFQTEVDQGLAWLDSLPAGARFFLFLHTYEVHHPYTPSPKDLARFGGDQYHGWLGHDVSIPELVTINEGRRLALPRDVKFIEEAYDAEIYSMDRALGHLLKALGHKHLLDRTALVFTSDHGEEFGEHGKYGWHGHTLYDELLRVPLVLTLPGHRWAGERIRRQVRLIDVAPTLADAAGLPIPRSWEGVSLLRILRGEEIEPLLAVSKLDTDEDENIASIRTGRWKLYDGRLLDLRNDPREQTANVAWKHPKLVKELQARLDELTKGGPQGEASDVDLDEKTVERLKALGYF